jgi:triosephosphate isomerase
MPIVCIGETLGERQAGNTFGVLEKQIRTGLSGIDESFVKNVIIAYEPVWAIGTGLAATAAQVQEAHLFVRNTAAEVLGSDFSSNLILYGGSMNDKNAESILELDDVNGGLIGGASLDPQKFLNIIDVSEKIISG